MKSNYLKNITPTNYVDYKNLIRLYNIDDHATYVTGIPTKITL